MSVTVTSPISGPYIPNGVTVDFPFDFKIASADELIVYRVVNDAFSLVSEADYDVTLAADGEGGTVTFSSAPASGTGNLYVVSDPSFAQTATFGAGGPFTPSTLNDLFDKAAIRDIALKRQADSALRAPLFETIGEMPKASSRANLFLAFNGSGDPIATAAAGPKGDPGSAGEGYATRAALAAVASPSNLDDAYLVESGRAGKFVFSTSNLSTQVTNDPQQGIYIPPSSDTTGASGAWVRQTNNNEYFLEWFAPTLDGTANDLAAIQAAINLVPLGGTLVFPGGKTAAISGGTVDFRNKGDTRFIAVGGRFTFKQLTANTPVAFYGATVPGLPQSGKLAGFKWLHSVQQTAAQTNGNGLVLYWCANAIFDDHYAENCHSPYTQASDSGTAPFNVVFDCTFDNIYAYGFTGRGFHLQPIGTAGTPNRIGRMYLSGGGQTALRGLSLVGQDENIEKLNIENGVFTEAMVWNSGGGSSVRIGKLYQEKVTLAAGHRGMVYTGVNSTRIDQWQINATTFDSAVAATVYLCTFFDGVVSIGSFGLTGITLTGAPVLQLFRAFNAATNPAKMVTVETVANPASVALSIGDTRDTLITKLDYPWPEQQAIASSGFINQDFRKGWTVTSTLTGAITIGNPVLNSRRKGRRATIILTQDATGGRTVSWDTDFAVTTAINAAANATTVWNVQWDGLKWREV